MPWGHLKYITAMPPYGTPKYRKTTPGAWGKNIYLIIIRLFTRFKK